MNKSEFILKFHLKKVLVLFLSYNRLITFHIDGSSNKLYSIPNEWYDEANQIKKNCSLN